jgi:hypothetical protein
VPPRYVGRCRPADWRRSRRRARAPSSRSALAVSEEGRRLAMVAFHV